MNNRGTINRRKILIKKLDELVSVYIRLRDKRTYGGHCPLCRKNPIECAFHIMRRGLYATRWDDNNLVGTCKNCNFRHERYPEYATAWFISKFGGKVYNELHRRAHKIAKFGLDDLQRIYEGFKEKIENGIG